MIYDGTNPLQAQQARLRIDNLIKKGRIFELSERKPKRTLQQNAYLWLMLSYWATQTGYTKTEAEAIYKDLNKDVYNEEKVIDGQVIVYTRHTNELDTREMTLTIDRFRNWSASNEVFPVYIPSPDDYRAIELMQLEVERNKEFLY